MSQSKAREARQTILTQTRRELAAVNNRIRAARAARTRDQQQALAIEKADIKAEKLANRAQRGLGSVAS